MTDIPRVLGGRYEVGELIGRGGMAQVHLGYDTRLSRTVAIKVLRADLAQDPMFLARFRREAQSAAALNHPSIVSVYDTGEEHLTSEAGKPLSLPYIVMEYVKGRTVASLLSDGNPVPIGEAVEITVGVLNALEYSHHEGIIHRDIKPGNVMLTPDGKVKVMDFGIARAIADSAATMTQTNSVVGTAQYLSPEQARGEVVDARSDLYSTGCLLYELLTGKPPFTGDSAVAVAYQHVSEQPKPASRVASDIPDALDRVVMKSLAKQREDRYQSAAEFRRDLIAAARGGGVEAPSVTSWTIPAAPAYAPTQVATASQQPQTGAAALAQTLTQSDMEPVDPETKKRQRRNKIMIWIGIIFLALAILGVVWAVLSGGKHTATPTASASTSAAVTKVPNLTGYNETEVKNALTNANLKYEKGDDVASSDIDEGLFVSATPSPGTTVPEGSTVIVSFSSGAATVSVPDLKGMTQDAAQKALEDANLTLAKANPVESTEGDPGTVVDQDPAAGEEVAEGTLVTIDVVSDQVTVPSVTGMSLSEAKSTLSNVGLSIDENRTDTPNGETDEVLSQNPAANTVAQRGTTVVLEVPSGKVTVPNVMSLSQADATTALSNQKLTPVVTMVTGDASEVGRVVNQDKAANSLVARGTTVTIKVVGEAAATPSDSPSQ